jgi:hypothetical protein
MTTDLLDDLIRSVLNGPLPDEVPPSWDGVVLRREGARAPRRSPRARVLLLAAALAALLVPPAVAFHDRILDLITGTPAPRSVQTQFETWNTLSNKASAQFPGLRAFGEQLPRVEPRRAVGVAELHTSAATVTLWAVPRRGGGECWLFVLRPAAHARRVDSSGSCDPSTGSAASVISSVQWLHAGALPGVLVLHARVRDVGDVQIELASGQRIPMEVVSGHALAAVPSDSTVTAVVARDAQGDVVQTTPVRLPPLRFRACADLCSGTINTSGSRGTYIHFGSTMLKHH